MLDVGCGTGAAARLAGQCVGPTGRVVGVDVNRGMLEVARSVSQDSGTDFQWLEGSASDLPSEDGGFDLVLCAQTLQFLPDPESCVVEMGRVLSPGGQLAISVWSDLTDSPYFHALVQAMSAEVGEGTARGLEAAFGLANPDEVLALVRQGGFPGAEIQRAEFDVTLPPAASFVPEHIAATPMSVGYDGASREARSAVVKRVEEAMAPFAVEEGIRVPFGTHLVTAALEG